jgi:hypothetical protein
VTFLTQVAATCFLGTQFAVLTPFMSVAIGLWFVGVGLWVALLYTLFTAVTVREPKPSLRRERERSVLPGDLDVRLVHSWSLFTAFKLPPGRESGNPDHAAIAPCVQR